MVQLKLYTIHVTSGVVVSGLSFGHPHLLHLSRENIFSLNTEGFTVFAILVQAIFPPTSVRIIVQTEIVSIGRDVLCLSAHTSILRLPLTALNSPSLLCTRHVTSPAPVCSSDE